MEDLKPADLWSGKYKIPWDDPDFSKRMLQEHLSQLHDMASRKLETIDAQVAWIHEHACQNQARRILDLGCGPGLYLQRLVALGHRCRGIDFGPASVEYARANLPAECEVTLGDIRSADFGCGFDVVAMIFGEINVFSPKECASILRKVRQALSPGGVLLLEAHTVEVVKRSGEATNTWYKAPTGLFLDRPHFCLQENQWLEDQAVALQQFHIIDEASGKIESYRNTVKAWSDEELQELFSVAGFAKAEKYRDWPTHSDDLQLWMVRT